MNLFEFIKTLLPRVETTVVAEDLRITLKELTLSTLPAYEAAKVHFRAAKPKSDEYESLSSVFYRNYGKPKSSNSRLFTDEIAERLPTLIKNATFLEKTVDELFERDIIKQGLTAKKSVVLKYASDVSFVSRFAIDLLDYLYYYETESKEPISKISEKKINKYLAGFARAFQRLSVPDKEFREQFTRVADVWLNESNFDLVAASDSTHFLGVKEPLSGFVYNPIFHIRMGIAEWQTARYKAYQDKKRLLELRLLQLQSQKEGEDNPQIEREIEYLQERIDRLEYKMMKLQGE